MKKEKKGELDIYFYSENAIKKCKALKSIMLKEQGYTLADIFNIRMMNMKY